MRNAGRLKLGYYPLPVEEAQNIRTLLLACTPYSAIDPCVGDGTALLEITKDTRYSLNGRSRKWYCICVHIRTQRG